MYTVLLCVSPSALGREKIKKNVFPSSCFSTFENNIHCLWKRSLFWSSGFPTSGAFYRKRQQQLVLQKMAKSTSTQSSALPASGSLFPQPQSRNACSRRPAPPGHSYLPWTLLRRVHSWIAELFTAKCFFFPPYETYSEKKCIQCC